MAKRQHGMAHGTIKTGRKRARASQIDREGKSMEQPKNIYDVFEFASAQDEKKTSRRNRFLKRAATDDINPLHTHEEEHDSAQNFGTAPILDSGSDNEDGLYTKVRDEDDEDIDSDEAFDESDEEAFADYTFRQSSARDNSRRINASQRSSSVSDDESQASIDDNDMVDLSKMLDDTASEVEEGEETEGSSEVEEDASHDRLKSHMEAIASQSHSRTKRTAGEAQLGELATGKRRVLPEKREAIPEGEWNAPVQTHAKSSTIEDLMKPVSDQAGTSFAALRSTGKVLQPSSDGAKDTAASKKGRGALNAPLPSVIQDRIDRSAAYDETKAVVQGWQPTIKRLREAEHLSFPLQPEPIQRHSTSSMAANFQPSNSFEKNIASLLEREGVSENQIAKAEELKMSEKGMSAEEIKHRTAELRHMRELLFREEKKAKRISKIKSKTYRRIARKQKQRELDKAREAGLVVEETEGNEDQRMKAERMRAQERATLKHKNAGKWAKNILAAKGSHDMPEARQAINEQLQKSQHLRRQIQGSSSDDSSSSEGEDDSLESDAFDELKSLQNQEENSSDDHDKKGVWNMKFMKDARNRRNREMGEEIDAFKQSVLDDADSQSNDERSDKNFRITATAGRFVFGGQNNNTDASKNGDEHHGTEESEAPRDLNQTMRDSTGNKHSVVENVDRQPDNLSNPWLSNDVSSKVSRKRNEAVVSKDGSAISKAENRIKRHAKRGDFARLEAEEDAELNIDPTARIKLRDDESEKNASNSQTPSHVTQRLVDEDDSSSDDESVLEDEPQDVSKGHSAMRQRDLVAEAFAGDDVLADFAKEKADIVESERPQDVNNFLPGWGSWGGKGVKANQARKSRFAAKTAGLDPSKRKDAGMDNVIINQKRDKKADKYKAKDVPYPYTSRAQYEMAMRNPMGPEWNTRTQHQRLTLPRVVTKPGKAIAPVGE